VLLLSEKHEFLCIHSESKSSLNKYFILKTNRQLFVRRERSRACTCSELQLSWVQLVTVAWTILNFCQIRIICNVNSKWIELSKYFIVLLLRQLYRIWGNFSHLTWLSLFNVALKSLVHIARAELNTSSEHVYSNWAVHIGTPVCAMCSELQFSLFFMCRERGFN